MFSSCSPRISGTTVGRVATARPSTATATARRGGKRILASAGGGSSGKKTSRADKGRKLSGFASAKSGKKEKKRSALADLYDEDDEPEVKSKEDKKRERYESQQIRALEKAERSRLNSALMEAGGLKTRADLREEYAGIPNTFKRKDGLAGDEMAEYLGMYYPEFGIEDERDLIDFLAA